MLQTIQTITIALWRMFIKQSTGDFKKYVLRGLVVKQLDFIVDRLQPDRKRPVFVVLTTAPWFFGNELINTKTRWGLKLSQMEGLIPAIESAHAFAVLDHKKFKPTDIVVINLSGRGDKDLNTYIDYFKL